MGLPVNRSKVTDDITDAGMDWCDAPKPKLEAVDCVEVCLAMPPRDAAARGAEVTVLAVGDCVNWRGGTGEPANLRQTPFISSWDSYNAKQLACERAAAKTSS
jgi:hypothetical protein